MSRYPLLALAVLVLAVLVAVLARPRSRPSAPPATEAVTRPEHALAVTIEGAGVWPARSSVPKGSRVTVTVENRDRVPRRLSLLGYEDTVSPAAVASGGTVTLTFAADRPGADFAWLVDGRPAGVLEVSGSHLVEGHR